MLAEGARLGVKNELRQRTALHVAAARGHDVVCLTLLQYGARVAEKDDCGFNAVHLAACNGHLATLNVLLRGAGNLPMCLHMMGSFHETLENMDEERNNNDDNTDEIEDVFSAGGEERVFKYTPLRLAVR
jgi:ankyrin repeat protein